MSAIQKGDQRASLGLREGVAGPVVRIDGDYLQHHEPAASSARRLPRESRRSGRRWNIAEKRTPDRMGAPRSAQPRARAQGTSDFRVSVAADAVLARESCCVSRQGQDDARQTSLLRRPSRWSSSRGRSFATPFFFFGQGDCEGARPADGQDQHAVLVHSQGQHGDTPS